MDRYPFLEIYIRLARVLAGIIILLAVIAGIGAWALSGFMGFLSALIGGCLAAFMTLVGADVLSCFKSIEQNTRKGP